jgi:hypothetical protein
MKEAIKNELLDEFNSGVRYHPLIQRLKGLGNEMERVIDAAASVMVDEEKVSAKDLNKAKESIKLLRMSLNTTFDPKRHTSVENIKAKEAVKEALNTICPLWPLYK